MGCPQCGSDEISPAGACLVCGYQVAEQDTGSEDSESEAGPAGFSGAINMDYSEGTQGTQRETDVPEWRQELSQRLNAIKQKRALASAGTQETKSPPVSTPKPEPVDELIVLQAKLLEKMPARKPRAPQPPPPRQIALQPLPEEPAETGPEFKTMYQQEIKNLIDNATSRPSIPFNALPDVELTPSGFTAKAAVDREGKLILLSRTLAGLVDLILIVLCTGFFIIAADYFSGIIVLDGISLVNVSALFLLNYFLYSLFFLSASNQTVGMMITDLRVVGTDNRRPSMPQLLWRCCGYLASLFGLGIGLLLSLFDRESRCFHDRQSGTRVVRI